MNIKRYAEYDDYDDYEVLKSDYVRTMRVISFITASLLYLFFHFEAVAKPSGPNANQSKSSERGQTDEKQIRTKIREISRRRDEELKDNEKRIGKKLRRLPCGTTKEDLIEILGSPEEDHEIGYAIWGIYMVYYDSADHTVSEFVNQKSYDIKHYRICPKFHVTDPYGHPIR